MATKKKQKFSDMLGEEITRSPIKKKLPDTSHIKNIARKEHEGESLAPSLPTTSTKAEIAGKKALKKKSISRTTFDFPTPIHRAMKKAAADEYTTLKNYVVILVRKDLKERGLLE